MNHRQNWIWYALSIGLAALFLIPVFWMLLISFRVEQGTTLTLANYDLVLSKGELLTWFKNTIFVACVTTVLVLFVCSMAAFAFSRLKFPGKKVLFLLILTGLMVPPEATVIPLYLQMKDFGLLNKLVAIILPAVSVPLGVFIMKQFYDGVPKEIEEAARIDGAGYFRIWLQIFVPLARPALAALGIITFIGAWNDYLWPLVAIQSQENMTVTLGLPTFRSTYSQEVAVPMTANAIASIPVIIAFLLFQKQIIKGVANTGGKEG